MGFDAVKNHVRFNAEKLSKNGVFSDEKLAMVDVYCARAGQQQRTHAHAHAAKCYVILEGRAKVTIGSDTREISAGEMAFAPRGVEHGLECVGPADLVALVFIAGAL
ncbi:MAG: cupin domain-containing protein [Deltaproteobacteria bacterium]|nr:cupin domain-containing protein [Deltaproteobacteria bacterium]